MNEISLTRVVVSGTLLILREVGETMGCFLRHPISYPLLSVKGTLFLLMGRLPHYPLWMIESMKGSLRRMAEYYSDMGEPELGEAFKIGAIACLDWLLARQGQKISLSEYWAAATELAVAAYLPKEREEKETSLSLQ